jgi:sortase A
VTRLFARRAARLVGAAGTLLLAQGRWIPAKAALAQVVLAGGSGEALAFGPSELGGTPRDVRVLAGHRDTHFRFLSELQPGDTLVLRRVDGRATRYRIDGFSTVRWNRFAYPASPGRPLLALATCLPNGTAHTPLRRVAWAEEA